MAAFNKFNVFVEDIANGGIHDLKTGTSDVFKVLLTNTAPSATNTVVANLTEISAGDGYTAGGNECVFTSGAQTGGVFKLTLVDPATWTSATGTFATFRYAVLYNDTSVSDSLIGWWDYGTIVSLGTGETFKVDLDQTNGVLTIT